MGRVDPQINDRVERPRESGYPRVAVGFDLVVLDFDGTFTDVEREAGPFFAAYKADAKSQLSIERFDEAWDEALATLARDPAHYGWTYKGAIVAPGNADPYLRATVVINMLLDERGLYPDIAERQELLQGLYHRNYPKADTVFRDDAKQVVEALIASGIPTVVVTNSDTEAVNDKIAKLDPIGRDKLRVCGNAKKFIVRELDQPDPAFDAIPETMSVEGLRRPILLRRGDYFEQMRALWNELDTTPEKTLVVGDIYELDLALPSVLGSSVHLVLKDMTEDFERRAIEASANAELSEGLDAVLTRVGL